MAFNFNAAGIRTIPQDYSWIANIPKEFWGGQAEGRQAELRANVSKILENGGSWEDVAKEITKTNPELGYKLQAQNDTENRFGISPVFDDKGNAYQLNARGGAEAITLPNGSQIQQPQVGYQTPQGVYIRGKFGGPVGPQQPGQELPVYGSQGEADAAGANGNQSSGYISKDYAAPEQQKVLGETAGKARAALPATEEMVRRVTNSIDEIAKDPNLTNAIGPINSRLATLRGPTADVEAKIGQAVGGVFTSAYKSLRGAQAITDIEGQKATGAIARVENLKQSDAGYKAALRDAQYEVFELGNVVRKKAGIPPVENPYHKPGGQQSGEVPVNKVKVYDIYGEPVE